MEFKEVFEPIINFMKNFQKKEKEKEKDISKQAAKDRLKLVLMQDRASVSPDFFEMMKKEIIDVIKKYIEIDEESLEVQLTRGFEAGLEGPALYANIPIKNIKPVASKGEDEEVKSNNILNMSEAEIEKFSEVIVDEIFEEAEAKVKEVEKENVLEANIVEIENIEEPVKEEKVNRIEDIAKNVAKEMKKTATKASTTKSTAKKTTTTKKTTKKTVAS